VLYDDTGLATWSPFGGRVNMPTAQKLADDGLTYSQWHTTALCSPTRSCMLTGRNHHVNRFASITEGSNGFPGASARLPAECATIGQVLQDNGYSTFWVGKNHNVPEEDVSSGGSKSEWPLQKGFDRFYRFLGGETNQWYPDLVEDNQFIDQPCGPEEGYHLSKDLADHALKMLRDQNATNPSKPWYMWFCPGANHAPHHAGAITSAPKLIYNSVRRPVATVESATATAASIYRTVRPVNRTGSPLMKNPDPSSGRASGADAAASGGGSPLRWGFERRVRRRVGRRVAAVPREARCLGRRPAPVDADQSEGRRRRDGWQPNHVDAVQRHP
jgi:hypothetical protein